MKHLELGPEELLGAAEGGDPAFQGERLAGTPWCVRWDQFTDSARDALLDSLLPPTLAVRTSGSTGEPATWWRAKRQWVAEAAVVADLLGQVDAVVAFPPPRHMWGTVGTVLLPALLGIPVWYQPSFDTPLPTLAGGTLGVIAIPWTFPILLRQEKWMRRFDELRILHSTAALPATSAQLADRVGRDRVRITEIFGSTETGAMAYQQVGADAWTLFPDVTLAGETPLDEAGGSPLVVASPRLASGADGQPLRQYRTEDIVEFPEDRRFRLVGRRGRLCKINGRRVNLDEVQATLRAQVECADLACFPVADQVRGENFIVVVVPAGRDESATRAEVLRAAASLAMSPHQVVTVEHIDRSETGKLLATPLRLA
jgi:acyl-coenzyme A synthetase/AMP-(fatty) acid ligase